MCIVCVFVTFHTFATNPMDMAFGMGCGYGTSVLNRSQNSESIIKGVFDSIIDFKSIFRLDSQVP